MTSPWDQRLGVWWIADDHPDAPAIAASPSGARTYAELVAGAHQLVHTFRGLGVEPGDSVAAMLPNGLHLIELSLACQEAGWYFTPLNSFLTHEELRAILEHSGAAIVAIHEQFAAIVDAAGRDGVGG